MHNTLDKKSIRWIQFGIRGLAVVMSQALVVRLVNVKKGEAHQGMSRSMSASRSRRSDKRNLIIASKYVLYEQHSSASHHDLRSSS